jgi:hypothetical protein
MALQGSLAKMGIAEILQLAGVQQKTGIIHVGSEDDHGTLQVLLLGGRIVGCRIEKPEKRDLLGNRLLAAGVINKDQLAKALKVARKDGTLLGDVLLAQQALDTATRDHFIMLQLRERLCGVFEWGRGTWRLEAKARGFTPATKPTLSAEAILMDGFRMIDEWPLIRTKISSPTEVFKVLRSPEEEESDAEALERVLDDAFSEFVDESDGGANGGLGRNERTVFDLVDGKRTVQQIVDLSRLGEFEASKAMVGLLSDGYIGPVKQHRARKKRGKRQSPLATIGKVLLNLVVLGAVIGAFWLLPSKRIQLDANAAEVAHQTSERLRTNRIVALSVALEVFRYEHGSYPQTLDELVEVDIIDAAMLDATQGLRYISIGTDYDLR